MDRYRQNTEEWLQTKQKKNRLDVGMKFLLMRVVRPWHRLPGEVVAVLSLEVFTAKSDRAWSNLVQWKASLSMARG